MHFQRTPHPEPTRTGPLTPIERLAYDKERSEERVKRGFTSFTRPKRREEVTGSTVAENTLQRYQRQSQVTGRKPVQ